MDQEKAKRFEELSDELKVLRREKFFSEQKNLDWSVPKGVNDFERRIYKISLKKGQQQVVDIRARRLERQRLLDEQAAHLYEGGCGM